MYTELFFLDTGWYIVVQCRHMKAVKLIEQENKKLTPYCLTPFPKKRVRDKTITYLNKMYTHKKGLQIPTVYWSAILMNSFYTQERLVCAVTKKDFKELCDQTDKPFKESQWKDFIRICCATGMFTYTPGLFDGQPGIFTLTEETVLQGFKYRNPEVNLEKMRSDQLAEVQAFVGKAKEIKKNGRSRNQLT